MSGWHVLCFHRSGAKYSYLTSILAASSTLDIQYFRRKRMRLICKVLCMQQLTSSLHTINSLTPLAMGKHSCRVRVFNGCFINLLHHFPNIPGYTHLAHPESITFPPLTPPKKCMYIRSHLLSPSTVQNMSAEKEFREKMGKSQKRKREKNVSMRTRWHLLISQSPQ